MFEIRSLSSQDFPSLLREINDKPKTLNICGSLPNQNEYKFLAVVGSRKQTQYGRDVTEKIIGGLRGKSVCIVSGLAIGTDAYAHECALKAGLKTIAVPGSGLEESVLYPSSNLGLAKRILKEGGCLLSEFANNMKAAPYTFPQRNRIMAGMSHATLIIECSLQSGTLITARLALEYNRDVLTVPGSIFSENSKGPHSLIRNGATLVETAEDVLDALNIDTNSPSSSAISDLSDEESLFVKHLDAPISREDLYEVMNIDIARFNMLVSSLEIKGVIKESVGKIYKI